MLYGFTLLKELGGDFYQDEYMRAAAARVRTLQEFQSKHQVSSTGGDIDAVKAWSQTHCKVTLTQNLIQSLNRSGVGVKGLRQIGEFCHL